MKRVSARAIILQNNKVLLIYREKGGESYYSIPGGKNELNETLEATVIREVLEETCIYVKPLKFLGKFEHTDKKKEQNLFLCEYLNGTPKLGDSVEMAKMSKDPTNYYRPEWVDMSLIFDLKIRPDPCELFFKNYIKQHLER